MDIVSFETAKKLKDAGFPQPESGFPLIWYGISDFDGADGRRHETYGTVITMLGYMAMPYVVPLAFSEKVELGKGKYKELIFAPTATDILRQMPDGYAIYRVNLDMFICKNDMPLPGDERCFTSASEAVSFVWLSENTRMFKMEITGDAWKHQL